MAVSPDLLLNIKAPTAAAKAANASPKPAQQSSRDEASSFANVYAKERQGKPAEAQNAAAKPARDKPTDEEPSQETDKASGTEKPATAETGNDLPASLETVDDSVPNPEAELDPLLLFGMGGQGTVSEASPVDELPLPDSELLVGLAQPVVAAESLEAEGETVLAGQRTLELQSANQKSPVTTSVLVEEGTSDAQETLPAGLLEGEALADESDDRSLEEGFGELLEKLDASKDSRPSASGEAALNRLNPLTQALAQQNQTQQLQRPTMVPGQPVQMQQTGWSEAVVDRVMWLSSQNLKSAEIQLDPAELGRMEVRIDMTKDQTQVTFLSPHAAVRDALEGQMQRLRDMFAQQGMTMDVNVSDQSRGWRGDGGGESRDRGAAGVSTAGDDEVVQGSMEISSARTGGDRGLVDYYA
ncbi:flagellar hook-length control protein [Pseudomonas sp. 10B238]|jgi:flagellar hook-length control protein FliK|uniref:flagellar hook-length control protein FliK n=1 Tax=Pseudomonadaceae TaxID=135621 RepID=UPI000617B616|nr:MULTISPECIES: flagellar hook-length control protein FliK [Pseudomonadaceae]MAL35862.1 flagellar hook-length control protein FliK [Pseudomonas sp.]MBU0951096.1 flagellar hook-length control protein FliK [Gammaproteobacteria bacterium]KJJ63903.1 flagellar hook-length control protein [Pseudomonas sp. 10B238]MBK3794968.1 flagellar hook-length control protein FliK [Stutzerimonas stutzeri]MBK3878679.1 flagellar hook-length control protein FliK [Stutzerimonas stutzeri]|tara:strand:- start:235 stop:1476 length:1242 start_codon:yes stop_codon:yes gene_type:complete